MRALSHDDVRAMVRAEVWKAGKTRQLWAELNGISPNHLSNFMQGWCGPARDLMVVLGIVKVFVLAADLPEGFTDNSQYRRPSRSKKRVRIEDEDPML